jgi:hypothetical protein
MRAIRFANTIKPIKISGQSHREEILSTPPYYIRYVSSEIVELTKPMHIYHKLSQGKIRTNMGETKKILLQKIQSKIIARIRR